MPAGIALLGLLLNGIVAIRMAPTADEESHVAYGASILRGDADRTYWWYDSKTPVSAINAIPRAAGNSPRLRARNPALARLLRDIRLTRWATLAAAFCLCLLVYFYAESLFGRTAGLFAQLIFILSPNIIAHSSLATADLYAALAFVLCLYCFRRFLLLPSASNAAFAGAALAAAQLVKFVAGYLYPALLIVLLAVLLCRKFGRLDLNHIPGQRIALLMGVHVICFLAFINVGFVFDRTMTPLAEYRFRSAVFQSLQQVELLRRIRVPVPYPFLQGFDWMSYNNESGTTFGNIVLLGELRGRTQARSSGFPSYYLVCYALKEPIGLQLLLLLAVIWLARNRQLADFLTGEFPLIVTAAVVIGMLSFFSKTQIGIRHILPALVAFVILSGAAFSDWEQSSTRKRVLLGVCLLYAAISATSYFPHMIPYFNEVVTDRKMAYRYLADSNLDWDQDMRVVDAFLKNNPDVKLNPKEPVAGRVLVQANLVAGVRPENADYWVRARGLEPVAHVGYGHLLFEVPSAK